MKLEYKDYFRRKDPRLGETLDRIEREINGIHTQVGSAHIPVPPTIASITVTASNGFFSVSILDPAGQAQSNLGLHYFVEWSTNPSFISPNVEDIGPSRGEYLFIGNLTTYWRVTSQFRNSSVRSPYVYFGGASNPTAVTGGGAAGGSPPGGGSGSGGGGGGFGGGGARKQ